MYVVIHLKTGNEYTVLGEVRNCTNNRDGEVMVLYSSSAGMFVREKQEFWQKFREKIK